MRSTMIFLPAAAMVLLVAMITFRMFFERKRQMIASGMHMRDIPSSSQMASRFADTRAADNYKNLFEGPVLFYVALVTAFATAQVSPLITALAWTYVVLRYLHSYIHCTYNRVRHRLYVFLASNIVLWGMWIALVAGVLRTQ